MKKIIIYGALESGINVFKLMENKSEVLFFVDGNEKLWGQEVCGKKVFSPEILKEYKDVPVYLGSKNPITRDNMKHLLYKKGIFNIFDVEINIREEIAQPIIQELNKRTIDLGLFMEYNTPILLKELTFISGGSGVLDYAFLRTLVKCFRFKNYLEIGTYIGESVNVLSDLCEKCYSITAHPDAPYSAKNGCIRYNIPDYSERLAYADNIIHFYENSQMFDYNKIEDEIDLYFIDGDHSYEGVKIDTEKVFASRKKDSIVVWHDVKDIHGYNAPVLKAIYDTLGEEFRKFYVTNNNLCGIFLPDKFKSKFQMKELCYTKEPQELYVYNTSLEVKKIN